MSKEKELNKVNAQLLAELEKFEQVKKNIELVAQLTILSLKSQREYQMGTQDKLPIEVDDVTNNAELVANEYDITFSKESGKLYIANNSKDSKVILQLIAHVHHPDRANLPGLCIDKIKNVPKGADALLSGIFYIENLPVDLMEKLREDVHQQHVAQDSSLEEKSSGLKTFQTIEKQEEKINIAKEYDSLEAYENDHKTGDKNDPFNLRVSNPKTLKAPSGLSRNGRKEWWEKLRSVHPEAFDKGGNWIGFDADSSADSSVDAGAKDIKVETKAPAVQNTAIGLLRETGVGNLITSIIDARVTADTYFIGRYFEQKNGFVVASTPAKHNTDDISAMLFFEKFKTADFVLKGLLKNPTWEPKLEGCAIHPVSQLSSEVRTDRKRHIYYISNGLTALRSLGSQAKEIEEVAYTEVK